MLRNVTAQISNMITLTRVMLSCILSLYIVNHFGSTSVPVVISLIVFATDFIDGKIAKYYKSTSLFGAYFDIVADMFYILSFYIVLYHFNIVPMVFLFVILFKFLEFVITSLLHRKFAIIKSIFLYDPIGRMTAAIFYIFPILAYLSFVFFASIHTIIIYVLIYIETFLSFVSCIQRILIIYRLLKS